jgi:hypothetical protein
MTGVTRYDQSQMNIELLTHSRVITAKVSWLRDVSLFWMYAVGACSSRYGRIPVLLRVIKDDDCSTTNSMSVSSGRTMYSTSQVFINTVLDLTQCVE